MPATRTAPAPSARDRLLAAADELFYEAGIHTVGIDRIIEKAGVAKATLYSAFGSKDELIRAYLEGRLLERQERIGAAIAPLATPREKILGVFDSLARTCERRDFNGCAFMNASAESPAGGVVEQMSDQSRGWTYELFLGLAREAAAADPELLARQLLQVYTGGIMTARLDRDSSAAATARAMAAVLVDAAT